MIKLFILTFFSVVFFKEFLVINYEIVIIVGFLIVFSFLIKNLAPLFKSFFASTQSEITAVISNKLIAKANKISQNIEIKKTIILSSF